MSHIISLLLLIVSITFYSAASNIKFFDSGESSPPDSTGVLRDSSFTGTTATKYEYDLEGRLKRTIYPDSSMTSFEYDAIDGKVKRIIYDFDDISISYDSTTGKTCQIATSNDTLSYIYDGPLLLSETWRGIVNASVNIRYDNSFRKICEFMNVEGKGISDSVNIQYNRDDMPIRIGKMGMKYSTVNTLLLGDTVGNTINEYTYDIYGDLATKKTKIGANVLYQVTYSRDLLSRITGKDETISGILTKYSYKYEISGRLSEVRRNDTLISTYVYDPNGNRLAYIAGADTIRGKYDAQDRLIAYSSARYSYTPNGELTCKAEGTDTTWYTYDKLGNLLSVSLPDGNLIEYVVDGCKRRIAKKVNGSIVSRWIYSGGLLPIAELDSADKITARYVVGSYVVKNDTTYKIITDQLGSTRLAVNSITGEIVQRIDYDEYGNVEYDSNPGFTILYYAGGFYDSQTSLIRFGARDYDAETGRWTTKDPIGFGGGDGNLYAYVGQDPINVNDAKGLWTTAAHRSLITNALSSKIDGSKIDVLVQAGAGLDLRTQGQSDSYMHAMAAYGESIDIALGKSSKFIQENLDMGGEEWAALYFLGLALHTVTDAFSPLHRDPNGNPKSVKNIAWQHTGLNEGVGDITADIYNKSSIEINRSYEYVFGKK